MKQNNFMGISVPNAFIISYKKIQKNFTIRNSNTENKNQGCIEPQLYKNLDLCGQTNYFKEK